MKIVANMFKLNKFKFNMLKPHIKKCIQFELNDIPTYYTMFYTFEKTLFLRRKGLICL